MENNELKHSGIKGMRWGVRRWQNKDGSLTPAGKKRYDGSSEREDLSLLSDDELRRRTNRARLEKEYEDSKTNMSDAELRQRINRIELEKRYDALTTEEVSRGQKAVNGIGNFAAKTAAAAATIVATQVVTRLITNYLDTKMPKVKT